MTTFRHCSPNGPRLRTHPGEHRRHLIDSRPNGKGPHHGGRDRDRVPATEVEPFTTHPEPGKPLVNEQLKRPISFGDPQDAKRER